MELFECPICNSASRFRYLKKLNGGWEWYICTECEVEFKVGRKRPEEAKESAHNPEQMRLSE